MRKNWTNIFIDEENTDEQKKDWDNRGVENSYEEERGREECLDNKLTENSLEGSLHSCHSDDPTYETSQNLKVLGKNVSIWDLDIIDNVKRTLWKLPYCLYMKTWWRVLKEINVRH